MRQVWGRDPIDEVFDRFHKWRRRRDELEADEIAFLPSDRRNGRQMAHTPFNRGCETIDGKVHGLNGFDGKGAARIEQCAVRRDVDHTDGFADPERSPAGTEDLESRMLSPVS
jgi:hypothetical protein